MLIEFPHVRKSGSFAVNPDDVVKVYRSDSFTFGRCTEIYLRGDSRPHETGMDYEKVIARLNEARDAAAREGGEK